MNIILKEEYLINFFTDKEKLICKNMNSKKKIEWLAGRFAAKEAIYKAINSYYNCSLRNIEILVDKNGAPYCEIENFEIYISISHDEEYAIAFAIVCTNK